MENKIAVSADLTQMSPVTLGILVGGVIILFIVLLIALSLIFSKLKKPFTLFGVSLGPNDSLDKEIALMQKSLEFQSLSRSFYYNMDSDGNAVEESYRQRLHHMLAQSRSRFMNAFQEVLPKGSCFLVLRCLNLAIRQTLSTALTNNHFTRVFSSGTYKQYYDRLFASLIDELNELSYTVSSDICDKDKLPDREVASKILDRFLSQFLLEVCSETKLKCERKVAVYEKYIPEFTRLEDASNLKIAQECLAKNTKYIESMDEFLKRNSG
jgi:hypothetical protein